MGQLYNTHYAEFDDKALQNRDIAFIKNGVSLVAKVHYGFRNDVGGGASWPEKVKTFTRDSNPSRPNHLKKGLFSAKLKLF